MGYENSDLYQQVLGSLMKMPSLLQPDTAPLAAEDFTEPGTTKNAKLIFFAINNLISAGANKIDIIDVITYLQGTPTTWRQFQNNNGETFLTQCFEKGDPDNYPVYYTALRKLSLLRDLAENGYHFPEFDYEAARNRGPDKEREVKERADKATEEEILNSVEAEFTKLRARHTIGTSTATTAAEDIDADLAALREKPDIGAELCGEYFNSICRGARLGTFYLRSATQSVGKTRLAVFDACNIAYPFKYDESKQTWMYRPDVEPQKVLYVVTEQTARELRFIILAYLSSVEERFIRANTLSMDQELRVRQAADIVKAYADYFHIEEITDPDLNNVSAVIKKQIRQNHVKYIFYDYIFTSPGLIREFTAGNVRQDVALGMLANQLKEIAKTENVFIFSASQLNGEGFKEGEKKDQRMLRDDKGLADKIDLGFIFSEVSKVELDEFKGFFEQYGYADHVIDVYKVRSGAYKNVRIWCQINMGNGERKDLFMTTQDKKVIQLESYEFLKKLESIPVDLYDYIKKGDAQ